MPPVVFATRQTDIAHHANQSPAGNQRFEAPFPHFVQLGYELVVIPYVPQLRVRIPILFERPIRWRSQNQMNALGSELWHLSRISQENAVPRRDVADYTFNDRNGAFIPCQS